MQCLVAIPELVSFFLTAAAEGGQGKLTGPVSGAFGSLVQQLWPSYGSAIDPYQYSPFHDVCAHVLFVAASIVCWHVHLIDAHSTPFIVSVRMCKSVLLVEACIPA